MCFTLHMESATVPLNSAPNADIEPSAANASTVNTFFTEHLPGKDVSNGYYYTPYGSQAANGFRSRLRPAFRTPPPRRHRTDPAADCSNRLVLDAGRTSRARTGRCGLRHR